MYVVFENPTEIDPRSIKTFGVSVKGTENPIGFFGTGLKYAIAILLREDQNVHIYSGTQVFEFAKKTVEIRGKHFSVITMNGEELPFTTELGKTWDMWQCYRELHCNCIDEAGEITRTLLKPKPEAGKTKVIAWGREIESSYLERDQIVLGLSTDLLRASGDCEVYEHPSTALYYRGIKVLTLKSPAKLTYNVKTALDLTEDRTVKFEHQIMPRIMKSVCKLTDKRLIKDIVTAGEKYFESDFDYSFLTIWQELVAPEFNSVIENEHARHNDQLSKSAKLYIKSVIGKRARDNYEEVEMTSVEKAQLDKCVKILTRVYPDFADYPIVVVKTLGNTTMAYADMLDNKMVISRESFIRGTKYLLSTLMEEFVHLKTGHKDYTLEMQTYLFDEISTLIENYVIGEPV